MKPDNCTPFARRFSIFVSSKTKMNKSYTDVINSDESNLVMMHKEEQQELVTDCKDEIPLSSYQKYFHSINKTHFRNIALGQTSDLLMRSKLDWLRAPLWPPPSGKLENQNNFP